MAEVDKCKLLLKCPKEKALEFLHGVMDGICGNGSLQYPKYSEVWGLEEWWEVNDRYRDFCQQSTSNSWSKDEISQRLEGLPEEYRKLVTDAILLRQDDMRSGLVAATSSISHAQLRDFDWQMKLVMSSDKLASVQEPLISVDFDVESNSQQRQVSVEMNREDLRKFIASLEGAHKAVLQLKT